MELQTRIVMIISDELIAYFLLQNAIESRMKAAHDWLTDPAALVGSLGEGPFCCHYHHHHSVICLLSLSCLVMEGVRLCQVWHSYHCQQSRVGQDPCMSHLSSLVLLATEAGLLWSQPGGVCQFYFLFFWCHSESSS